MKHLLTLLLAILCIVKAEAHEITYHIVSYNNDVYDFVLAAWGEKPMGSAAYFVNEYGATSGNRYNQLPRNREAQLYLFGWEGCTIKSITFSMCSNNKAGTVGFSVKDGETELYNMKPIEFQSEDWFGEWVSKDLGVYVDITKTIDIPALSTDELIINLKAGTKEGSVYINSITIDYDAPETMSLESPLGYVFEKLGAKDKLNSGDVIMLYRSGNAAADLGGMEESKYLDALGITSTNNVIEPDLTVFTLGKSEDESHWTLTDQYGQVLGATAAQSLAWNEGVMTWDIDLGYDGATIASTNSKYGTIRFNAPAESYARFWNYTSKSLTLPYIYRRSRQIQPTVSSRIDLSYTDRTVELGSQDTLVCKAALYPATTTDLRINWQSNNPEVATVKGGIIHPLTPGEAVITATSGDGASSASMTLKVVEATSIENVTTSSVSTSSALYGLNGQILSRPQKRGITITNGKKILSR